MKKIRGILIDVDMDHPILIEVEDQLEKYYDILNCRCIDIVTRKIGDKYFDIICDDEALLKGDPILTAISRDKKSYLFGNLLIVNSDNDGNLRSLSKDDIDTIYNDLLIVKENENINNILLEFEI